MRLLKNTSICPPDNFTYLHAETGHTTEAIDYYNWVQKAVEHRQANGLSVPTDFPFVMQDQLCQRLSGDWCEYEKEGNQSWVNTRISLSDVVDFTRILLAQSVTRQYVSEEEAERRAKICGACYFNVAIAGCGACVQLAALVAGSRTTQYDSNLKSCAVCHCTNKAQVHISLDVLEVNDTQEKQNAYPSFCWKQKASANYFRVSDSAEL